MKKGMNPEAVEQMAQRITEAGDEVQQAYTEIQGRVTDLDWTGEDRDRFVSEFESTIGQMVQQVVQQAGDLSERATRNAADQRNTSA